MVNERTMLKWEKLKGRKRDQKRTSRDVEAAAPIYICSAGTKGEGKSEVKGCVNVWPAKKRKRRMIGSAELEIQCRRGRGPQKGTLVYSNSVVGDGRKGG